MHKPLFLAILGFLGFSGLTGCAASQTWKTVMQSRADFHSNEADAFEAYAAKLHHVLRDASVEHKVVTYQYHYLSCLRGEEVGTRTAVLYRDDFDPANPWWLMEEDIGRPVWLPGDQPKNQLEFYIHHPVDVVHERDYPGSGKDYKSTAGIAHPACGTRFAGAVTLVRFRIRPSLKYDETVAAPLPQSDVKGNAYAALFRSVYGKSYHASSARDRRKMVKLQNDALRHRRPLAVQTY
jgi:hypothetical protein